MNKYNLNSIKFISPIKPLSIKSYRNTYKNILFLKFSFLIFSWLKSFSIFFSNIYELKVSFLPKKSISFSFSKAPMAHKTNSHESYRIKIYLFRIFFKYIANSTNTSSYNYIKFLIFIQKIFFLFGTNLLQVKVLDSFLLLKVNDFLYL